MENTCCRCELDFFYSQEPQEYCDECLSIIYKEAHEAEKEKEVIIERAYKKFENFFINNPDMFDKLEELFDNDA